MTIFYTIRQNRNSRDLANISEETKEIITSFDLEYYKILAIISKIFDDNIGILDIGIVFNVIDNEIVIRGSMMYGNYEGGYNTIGWVELKEIFEKNDFKYKKIE